MSQTEALLDGVYSVVEAAAAEYPQLVVAGINHTLDNISARGRYVKWTRQQILNGLEPTSDDVLIYKEPKQLNLAGMEFFADAAVGAAGAILNPYTAGLFAGDFLEMAKMPKFGKLFDEGIESFESAIQYATTTLRLPIPRLPINETLKSATDYFVLVCAGKNIKDGDVWEGLYKLAALLDPSKRTGFYVGGIISVYLNEAIRNNSDKWRPRTEVTSQGSTSAELNSGLIPPLDEIVKLLSQRASSSTQTHPSVNSASKQEVVDVGPGE